MDVDQQRDMPWWLNWARVFEKLYYDEVEGPVPFHLRLIRPPDEPEATSVAELNLENYRQYYRGWRFLHGWDNLPWLWSRILDRGEFFRSLNLM